MISMNKNVRYLFLLGVFALLFFTGMGNAKAEFVDYFASADQETFSTSKYRKSGYSANDVRAQCVYNYKGQVTYDTVNYVFELYTDGSYQITSITETGYVTSQNQTNTVQNWDKERNDHGISEVAKDLYQSSGCPQVLIESDSPMGFTVHYYMASPSVAEEFDPAWLWGNYQQSLVYSSYANSESFESIGDASQDYRLLCKVPDHAIEIKYAEDGSIRAVDYTGGGMDIASWDRDSALKNQQKISELVKENKCPDVYITAKMMGSGLASFIQYTVYFSADDAPDNATEENGSTVTPEQSTCSLISDVLGSDKENSIGYNYKKYNETGNAAYLTTADNAIKLTATYCEAVYETNRYDSQCLQICLNRYKTISELKVANNIQTGDDGGNCYLSANMVQWLLKIMNWIRYIVPAILIILTILDFIKAIAADNEDEIKKVSGKFAKRLMAAVLIFVLPAILEFVLGIFDITTNGFCL